MFWQPRVSRDRRVRALRRRIDREGERPAHDEAADAARNLFRRKLALAEIVGDVDACSTCARGTGGRFDGGACCGGATDDVFSDDEVAALALAGTTGRARSFRPGAKHAGCSFRGATGCTLAVAQRPAICVHYGCGTFTGELAKRDDRDAIMEARDRLADAMRHFSEVEADRRAAELFAESFAGAFE